jgi:hypothetical protein
LLSRLELDARRRAVERIGVRNWAPRPDREERKRRIGMAEIYMPTTTIGKLGKACG